jgi:hypothetical protein
MIKIRFAMAISKDNFNYVMFHVIARRNEEVIV